MQRAVSKFTADGDSLARAVYPFHTLSLAGLAIGAMCCPGLKAENLKEQGTPLSVTRIFAAEIR